MTEPSLGGASAGALLRAAREKQGLHIAALAAAIKVAPRKLDALENDRWGELPDATFTRALAQTVCRTLKIDARPVLQLLPPAGSGTLEGASAGLNAPFNDRPGRDVPGLAGVAIKPMVWAGGLLMLAAVAVYLLPPGLWSARAPAAPASAAALVFPPAAAEVAASEAGFAATESAMAASEPQAETLAASAPTVASVAVPPSPTVPLQAAPAASPAVAAGVLQVQTRAASWVEVRDARGQVLLSRVVQPGENLGLDGSLPIRLTIGNAAATQVGFRGRAIDLAPSTRDNVARLELQ